MKNDMIYDDLVNKMRFCSNVFSRLDSTTKLEYGKKMGLVQKALQEKCKTVDGRISRDTILPLEVVKAYEEFRDYHNENFISFGILE